MLASKLADLLKAKLWGDDVELKQIAPLTQAGQDDLSFLLWPQDIRLAKKKQVGCLLIMQDWAAEMAHQICSSLLVVSDVLDAFQKILTCELFTQKNLGKKIAKTAVIHPSAVIFEHASIGENTVIDPGVVIHDHCILGSNLKIGAHSVIGSSAFAPFGLEQISNLPSLGQVVIEDFVSIGAHCTVDKGLIGTTFIGKNSLLDNHVHIGHDVVVEPQVVIAAQTGVAGFSLIGKGATLGGQVGIGPHIQIGKEARISGKSGVRSHVPDYGVWSGNPAVPHLQYLKFNAQKNLKFKGKI